MSEESKIIGYDWLPGILSDDQIIELCNTNPPMIHPFIPHQEKSNNTISYGVSSYGYDARVSNEFKIFTNINSTIIDPKNFSNNNFVDRVGDFVIIPPNGFVLARTLEYFRIPKDVLVICLGKSTLARCFTGDTKVALADGTSASFEELIARSEQGETFRGYAVNSNNHVIMTELINPRKIGHEAVIEVVFNNDKTIRCTPDHEFLLSDRTLIEAKDLSPETKLYPFIENYKVKEIREVSGTHDVYCLTSPDHGNFALENGIFVKNCGIGITITPLEPEWCGHVTIEITNFTPLPAKIYANEGICQFLFLKGSKPCMTTYADKKGKYQGQTGITLPKIT